MSANLVRLRKRAAELEQKKQFDRALEVYVQILEEGGKEIDDEDVPLFNRVGDMLMRKGSVTEALGYYERAVDVYAERGYLNNAIALCSKILRQSPGRAAVYYKLARISARKGFKSDARKNFLEYADRMQKLGMADEAFRALKEFASLYPDQDDVRLILAELLSKENRKGEALEQLQSLYEKLQSEGRAAEARATVDRMRAIDPSVTPREGTSQPTPAAVGDLVFLDLNDAESAHASPKQGGQPASARAPVSAPVPELTGLSITFLPDEAEPEAPRPEGFESTAVESEPVETAPVTRSLTPAGSELVVEPSEPDRPLSGEVDEVAPLELMDDVPQTPEAPEPLERVEHVLEELAPAAAPRPPSRTPPPLSSFEFAEIDLDDAVSEVSEREHDLSLPGDLPASEDDAPDVDDETMLSIPSLESAASAEDARAAAEEAADLAADIAAREAGHKPSVEWRDLVEDAEPNDVLLSPPPVPEDESPPAPDAVLEGRLEPGMVEELPDDFLAMPPSFGAPVEREDDHAFPPLPGLDDAEPVEPATTSEHESPVPEPAGTPRATISIGTAESHLRSRLELDPENCELRRQLGEALLDTGDRDGGLYELELAMVGFELRGEAERAQEVVDVILKVSPASIAHHQKRVEYAVRSRDRGRLSYSYLELADALFRSGAADKAVAVYCRVIELDPGNERAEFALSTLAPDELGRQRGGATRPERWTDELAAISGEAEPVSSPSHGEFTNGTAAPVEEVPRASRVRFESLELPVPDWGEGVPNRDPSAESPAPDPSPADVTEAPEPAVLQRDDESGSASDEPVSEEPEREQPTERERFSSGSSAGVQTPFAVPAMPNLTPHGETAVRGPTPPAVPTPRPPTPASAPSYRDPTPVAVPAPSYRDPTPVAVPASRGQTPTTTSLPSGDGDAGFVDLGEWLRSTEPVRSTRMQVEDPKPSGNEQADFDEMLRRFKRGVAENVEAEDYEAHYDLGVAYKEMGLIDEAIAQFQKSLRDPDQRIRSYEALGQCFVEKKQFPIASALLQRATEVPGSDDQQLVGVLYLLGFANEHLGRPTDALPYYLRVFAVDIEFRDVAERVAALGKLTT